MTTDAPALPPILTVERVAEMLGVQPDAVHKMIRRGAIPARRIPGSRRVYVILDELLDAMERV